METSPDPPKEPLIVRLHRAFGPMAGGLILDFVDLATFGPIGVLGGFLIGFAAGWWVSSIYGFSPRARWAFAMLAMVYTALPLTEPFPIATAISALARFREQKPEEASAEDDATESGVPPGQSPP